MTLPLNFVGLNRTSSASASEHNLLNAASQFSTKPGSHTTMRQVVCLSAAVRATLRSLLPQVPSCRDPRRLLKKYHPSQPPPSPPPPRHHFGSPFGPTSIRAGAAGPRLGPRLDPRPRPRPGPRLGPRLGPRRGGTLQPAGRRGGPRHPRRRPAPHEGQPPPKGAVGRRTQRPHPSH